MKVFNVRKSSKGAKTGQSNLSEVLNDFENKSSKKENSNEKSIQDRKIKKLYKIVGTHQGEIIDLKSKLSELQSIVQNSASKDQSANDSVEVLRNALDQTVDLHPNSVLSCTRRRLAYLEKCTTISDYVLKSITAVLPIVQVYRRNLKGGDSKISKLEPNVDKKKIAFSDDVMLALKFEKIVKPQMTMTNKEILTLGKAYYRTLIRSSVQKKLLQLNNHFTCVIKKHLNQVVEDNQMVNLAGYDEIDFNNYSTFVSDPNYYKELDLIVDEVLEKMPPKVSSKPSKTVKASFEISNTIERDGLPSMNDYLI